jgi:hypothetical protein
MKKTILEITFDTGIFSSQVWKDAEGKYLFDGPACNGPKHIRESGRGPHWRGEVSPGYVTGLLKRLQDRGIEHKVIYAEGP